MNNNVLVTNLSWLSYKISSTLWGVAHLRKVCLQLCWVEVFVANFDSTLFTKLYFLNYQN